MRATEGGHSHSMYPSECRRVASPAWLIAVLLVSDFYSRKTGIYDYDRIIRFTCNTTASPTQSNEVKVPKVAKNFTSL